MVLGERADVLSPIFEVGSGVRATFEAGSGDRISFEEG